MNAPKRRLPPALAANIWKPGQSGNPSGLSGLYGETVKLARQASPEAIRRLIELMGDEDHRVAAVACNSVLDRAWGKREPPAEERPAADVSRLSEGDRKKLGEFLALIMRARGEAGEDDPAHNPTSH